MQEFNKVIATSRLNPYCIGCTSLRNWNDWNGDIPKGLNPYCIGCTSLSMKTQITLQDLPCLNPYCIGCTSLRGYVAIFWNHSVHVLILIVLDVLL